ncbi:MAG: hypothetical protein Q7J16_06090 [Candidatus Cloacimonadales bacterium]|nr:hypothetical protein [Candidatus Cloacimonadales bacterium]
MRSRYKIIEEDQIYFITSTIVEWIPVFASEKYFQILVDSIKFCQENKNLKIHAYVFLDNHIHLIASGDDLANTIKSFKMFTAKEILNLLEKDQKHWLLNQLQCYKKKYKISSEHQFWQEGYHPQMIDSESMFIQKAEYMHNNPVRRGLVDEPEFWKYSSAGYYINHETGVISIDDLFED